MIAAAIVAMESRCTAAKKVDDVGVRRWQGVEMRDLIEDDVRERICNLFGGVQGGPLQPGAAKFVVQFDNRDRRAKRRHNGRHYVTFNDAKSLVELCVKARYRGRAWASAWVRAVYMHGQEFLVHLGPDTPNLTWLRDFLALIPLDQELRPGNPNRRERFVWYIKAIEPYAPAPLTATQRYCALVDIARFYERAYEQLKLVDFMAKASARNLAFLSAERTFDHVVAEHPSPSAICTSRVGVRHRASKARCIAAAARRRGPGHKSSTSAHRRSGREATDRGRKPGYGPRQ